MQQQTQMVIKQLLQCKAKQDFAMDAETDPRATPIVSLQEVICCS